jgi:hypothetical protein
MKNFADNGLDYEIYIYLINTFNNYLNWQLNDERYKEHKKNIIYNIWLCYTRFLNEQFKHCNIYNYTFSLIAIYIFMIF